jgi:hypothetical protein
VGPAMSLPTSPWATSSRNRDLRLHRMHFLCDVSVISSGGLGISARQSHITRSANSVCGRSRSGHSCRAPTSSPSTTAQSHPTSPPSVSSAPSALPSHRRHTRLRRAGRGSRHWRPHRGANGAIRREVSDFILTSRAAHPIVKTATCSALWTMTSRHKDARLQRAHFFLGLQAFVWVTPP